MRTASWTTLRAKPKSLEQHASQGHRIKTFVVMKTIISLIPSHFMGRSEIDGAVSLLAAVRLSGL